jgi:hypothetical protein
MLWLVDGYDQWYQLLNNSASLSYEHEHLIVTACTYGFIPYFRDAKF